MSLQTRRGFFGTIAAVVACAVAVVTRKPEPQYFFVTRDVSRAEFEAEYTRYSPDYAIRSLEISAESARLAIQAAMGQR